MYTFSLIYINNELAYKVSGSVNIDQIKNVVGRIDIVQMTLKQFAALPMSRKSFGPLTWA